MANIKDIITPSYFRERVGNDVFHVATLSYNEEKWLVGRFDNPVDAQTKVNDILKIIEHDVDNTISLILSDETTLTNK